MVSIMGRIKLTNSSIHNGIRKSTKIGRIDKCLMQCHLIGGIE